jgi:hypothetical protein
MKVVNLAEQTQVKEESGLAKGIRKLLPIAAEKPDSGANATAIRILDRMLDSQYILLTGLKLPGLEVPIPMVLIGPPGVWVIYATSIKGVFKAREDTWEVMDDRFHRYRLAKPNLLKRTKQMTEVVSELLTARDFKVKPIEPALFLTDPGVHIDTARPLVRVVLIDALERFAVNLLQSRAILDKEAVHRISRALAGEGHPALEPKAIEDARDVFSFRELPTENPEHLSPNVIYDRTENPILKKVPFDRKQLLILGLMVVVNILVLAALVVLVVMNT